MFVAAIPMFVGQNPKMWPLSSLSNPHFFETLTPFWTTQVKLERSPHVGWYKRHKFCTGTLKTIENSETKHQNINKIHQILTIFGWRQPWSLKKMHFNVDSWFVKQPFEQRNYHWIDQELHNYWLTTIFPFKPLSRSVYPSFSDTPKWNIVTLVFSRISHRLWQSQMYILDSLTPVPIINQPSFINDISMVLMVKAPKEVS